LRETRDVKISVNSNNLRWQKMDNFLINVHILVGYEALVENPTYAQRKTFKVAKKTY